MGLNRKPPKRRFKQAARNLPEKAKSPAKKLG